MYVRTHTNEIQYNKECTIEVDHARDGDEDLVGLILLPIMCR